VHRAVIEDDGVGDYFITLKISDAAGNETMKSAVVSVNFLNSLLPILPFTPPTTAALTPSPLPEGEGESSNFGGTTSEPTGEVTSSPSTVGGGNSESTGEVTTSPSTTGGTRAEGKPVTAQTFSHPPVTSSFPIPTSAILWGAASAAAVGYFLSEAQKRKEEEEQKQAEARRALDLAHATEQESLAAMNAELRRQEEEERIEAEERREARTSASRIPTTQQSLQAIWDANGARLYEAKQAAAAQPKPVKSSPVNKFVAAAKKIVAPWASPTKKVTAPITTTTKKVVAPVAKPAPKPSAPAKTSLWSSFTSAVTSTVKKVVTPVVNTVITSAVTSTVKKVVTPVVNTVKKVVAPVVNTVKKVVAPVVSTVKKVVTPIVKTVKSTLNAGTTALTGVLSPAKKTGGGEKLAAPAKPPEPPTWLQNLIDKGKKVVEIGKKIVTATIEKGKELVETGKDFVENIWEDAKQWANDHVAQPTKDIINNAVMTIKAIATTTAIATEKKYKETKDWANDHFVQPIKDAYTWAENYADSLPPSLKDKIYAIGRDVAIHTIPPVAEFIYDNVTVPIVSFAQDHPYITEKTTHAINSVLDNVVRPVLNHSIDTNPNTMNWMDLGLTWLFELGDKEEITFGADSVLSKDIQKHDVVQTLRDAAIKKIVDGRLQEVVEECIATDTPIPENQYPVCMPNKYGVSKFVQSLGTAVLSGDLSYEYLGSYVVNINVEPLGNGHYKFHYYVNNPSTWESATRFRKDNNGDGVNEGIIPDTSPRKEGIKLGGKLDQTFEWSEEIYIPTGE